MLNLSYFGVNETRTYNSLLQLTRMTAHPGGGANVMDMQYNYSATQNNGRITSSNDYVTGENVSYTYDAVNRLTGASAGSMWGETYSYDGFGNLTGKNVTQPPAPTLGVSYDANNRQVGLTYDANGNQSMDAQGATYYNWNVENRLAQAWQWGGLEATTWYSYDPWGRRVMKDVNLDPGDNGYMGGAWEFYFYGITGQKLATVSCSYLGSQPNCYMRPYNVYFGGKLVMTTDMGAVVTDRLGSVRNSGGVSYSYFPYGEERTVTPDDTEKFGTYLRDGPGQDYARQRYYNNGTGRFWNVDPGGIKTADPSTPISLNRYAYVNGDPVNSNDRHGLYAEGPTAEWCIEHPDDPACYAPCGTGGLPSQFAHAMLYAPDPGCGPVVLPGPGGPEPQPPTAPSCLDGLNQTWVAFVETNYQDADTLGNISEVPSFQILGWAALESGWGTNTAATVNGNFFSWGGKGNVKCPHNADHKWGCFNPGFFLSGLTALESTHNYFNYGGAEGVSAASILLDQFSKGASIQTAFDALAQAGYTPDAGYGAGVATRSAQVLGVELCLTQLGIIGVPTH